MKSLLRSYLYLLIFPCLIYSSVASAHPHIFVDATLKIEVSDDGSVESLQQEWNFDPVFTAGVVLDFDKNGNRKLDPNELQDITRTIKESVAEYEFFQSIIADGVKITMSDPDPFTVSMHDKNLTISFENKPVTPFKLEKGKNYIFSITDPTFYVAIDFVKDTNLKVKNLPTYCHATIIRPDGEKILSQSQATEDFFSDPKQALDLATKLATRLEVQC